MILDNPNELFLVKEARLWLLQDGENELQTDNLCANDIVADLLISLRFLLTLDGEFDDGSENKNCILQGRLSFI